ncbi:hypothetical protein ACWGJQ_25865 [Peribacillus simplex]
MNINIKVYLHAKGINFLQSGSFPVRISEFKKNPDHAVAVVAYEWIKKINFNMGRSEDFRIDKVVYDSKNDISRIVKKALIQMR